LHDSVELAKRSQKLLCSPDVDLIPSRWGQHEAPLRRQDLPRMLNAAIQTARSFTAG
jgi:hypothetical protein